MDGNAEEGKERKNTRHFAMEKTQVVRRGTDGKLEARHGSAKSSVALAVHAPPPTSHAPVEWAITLHPSIHTFWQDTTEVVEALWEAFGQAAGHPLERNLYAGLPANDMLGQDMARFMSDYKVDLPDDWFDLMNYITREEDAGTAEAQKYMDVTRRSRYTVAREILVEQLERYSKRAAFMRDIFGNSDAASVFARACPCEQTAPPDRGVTITACRGDEALFREKVARLRSSVGILKELSGAAFPFSLPAPKPKRQIGALRISHADCRDMITGAPSSSAKNFAGVMIPAGAASSSTGSIFGQSLKNDSAPKDYTINSARFNKRK